MFSSHKNQRRIILEFKIQDQLNSFLMLFLQTCSWKVSYISELYAQLPKKELRMRNICFPNFIYPSLYGNISKQDVNQNCHYDILNYFDKTWLIKTARKVSKYGFFCGLYFPLFGLNTEIYSVSFPTQSKYEKIRTRKNSVFGLFLRSVRVTLKLYN